MNTITIITGYYFPEDTAIGLYNTQMVEYLVKKGYNITVITGFPCYPQWKIRDDYKTKSTFFSENINGVKIIRYKQYVPSKPKFISRILLLLDFTMGSFINILKVKRCDLVISIVPHTSTMLLGWILKVKTKSKLWNHIQDFEFEAAQETGILRREHIVKKMIFRILFNIETKLLNQGNVNSTISYNMLNKLKIKSKSKTYYFPNWIDIKKAKQPNISEDMYFKTDNFKILYSGNIGDKQDWEFFLLFSNALENNNVEIVVVGDGARREWLLNRLEHLKKVKYYPPVEYHELSNLLSTADLHILFQKSNVIDSVMPSKLLGMMASGRPSLVTGNVNSEVKSVIEESQGGFYISTDDIKECIAVVNNLKNNPDLALQLGANARKYIVNKFSSDRVLSSFEEKVSQIITNRSR